MAMRTGPSSLSREIVKRNPDRARAHTELAWFLVTCPDTRFRKPALAAEALQYARKAVELDQTGGDYSGLLGMASYRAGDLQTAADTLEKVADEMPDWSPLFLAMAH
jgi:hypothetical protein